jgi:membrane-anchored protein YejM (alkaline phosphatase superfamily)
MKTYKKFRIHLVNGTSHDLVVNPEKTIGEARESLFPTPNICLVILDYDIAIPWHGVAMIEGVDDEGKEK